MSKRKSNIKQGSMMKMLPVLIGIAAMSVITIMYLSYMNTMDRREAASQIVREYILRMESDGYLCEDTQLLLIEELEDIGLTNISLAGTTLTEVEYGNAITLEVNASVPMEEFGIENLFNITRRNEMQDITIVKKSTAKN